MGGWKGILSSKLLPFIVAAAFLVPGMAFGAQYAYYETAPEWAVGDTWVFRDNVTVTGEVRAGDEVEPISESETVFHTMKVLATDAEYRGFPAYELGVYRNGKLVDTFHLTKPNLNSVVTKAADIRADVPRAERGYEEYPIFQWPLTPGKSWEYTGAKRIVEFNTGDRDFLSLADTTLSTVRLESRLGPYVDAEAEEEAKKGGLITSEMEERYWWSGAAEAIAREEVDQRIHMVIPSRNVNVPVAGMSFSLPEMEFNLQTRVIRELVGATALGNAEGANIPFVNLSIALPEAIDFSKTQEATFKAVTAGTMPEGARVVWKIAGERYEGQEVTAKFEAPGRYSVAAEVLQADGAAIGGAADSFEVFWTGSFTGSFDALGGRAEYPFRALEGGYLLAAYEVTGALPTSNAQDDLRLIVDDEEVARGATIEYVIEESDEHTLVVSPARLEYADATYTLTAELRYPLAKGMQGSASEDARALALAALAPHLGRWSPAMEPVLAKALAPALSTL